MPKVNVSQTETVNQTSLATKPAKSAAASIVLILVIGIIVIVALVGGLILGGLWLLASKSETTATSNIGNDQNLGTCDVADNNGGVVVNCLENPAYRLTLDDTGYVDVPEGWKVSDIDVTMEPLTEAEQIEHVRDMSMGLWPIYKNNSFTLEDVDANTIKFGKRTAFVPFATGCEPIALDPSYTIVQEPTAGESREDYGFARKLDGTNYYFTLVALDEEHVFSDGYLDMNSCFFQMFEFTYSGPEAGLAEVDSIFSDACLNNSGGYCD